MNWIFKYTHLGVNILLKVSAIPLNGLASAGPYPPMLYYSLLLGVGEGLAAGLKSNWS